MPCHVICIYKQANGSWVLINKMTLFSTLVTIKKLSCGIPFQAMASSVFVYLRMNVVHMWQIIRTDTDSILLCPSFTTYGKSVILASCHCRDNGFSAMMKHYLITSKHFSSSRNTSCSASFKEELVTISLQIHLISHISMDTYEKYSKKTFNRTLFPITSLTEGKH